jgi:hypothetical protein
LVVSVFALARRHIVYINRIRPLTRKDAVLGLIVAAVGLAAPLASAHAADTKSLAIPLIDSTPVPGGSPFEAAKKAIGPLAETFVDHDLHPPGFIGDGTQWVVGFYRQPRIVQPGLCSVTFLLATLKREPAPSGVVWHPMAAAWHEAYRAVGMSDHSPAHQADVEKACDDQKPASFFPASFGNAGGGGFTAASAADAWRTVSLFEGAVVAAHGPKGPSFQIECADAFQMNMCASPITTLAGLMPEMIEALGFCQSQDSGSGCVEIDIHAPGVPGYEQSYWILELTPAAAGSVTPARVSMKFMIPPEI